LQITVNRIDYAYKQLFLSPPIVIQSRN